MNGHSLFKLSRANRVIFLFLSVLAHHLRSQAYNLQLWTVWPPVPSLLPLLCPVPSLSRPVIACCPPSAAGSVPSLCPLLYFKLAWVTSVPPPAGVGQMKGGRCVLAGRLCSRLITLPPHRPEPGPPACAPSDTRRQTPTPIPRAPNWALGYGRRHHCAISQTPVFSKRPAPRRPVQTDPKSPAAELQGARRVNKVFNHISPPSPWPPPPTPPFQKPPLPIPISAPSQRPTQGCSNPRLKGAGGEAEGAVRVGGVDWQGHSFGLSSPTAS